MISYRKIFCSFTRFFKKKEQSEKIENKEFQACFEMITFEALRILCQGESD